MPSPSPSSFRFCLQFLLLQRCNLFFHRHGELWKAITAPPPSAPAAFTPVRPTVQLLLRQHSSLFTGASQQPDSHLAPATTVESFSAPTAITNSQPLNHREQVLAEAAAHRKTEKLQENTEGRTSITPAHHTCIIVFAVSRESIGKKRNTETNTSVRHCPQKCDNRSCARTAASSSSPVSHQVSSLHSFHFGKFNYTVTVHAFVTVQVNYNSLEQ